jgi:predicted DNA-binding transcriptional regulator AlpA
MKEDKILRRIRHALYSRSHLISPVRNANMTSTERKETLLTGPAVCKRYGVSAMTLWRWQRQSNLGFPAPLRINRRTYFRSSELENWEQQRQVSSNRAERAT